MMPGRFDPERTLAAIARLKPTVLIAVPTLFRRLLAMGDMLERYDLRSLRMGMSSGEPLPEDTLRTRTGAARHRDLRLPRPDRDSYFHESRSHEEARIARLPAGRACGDGLNDEGRRAKPHEIGHLVIRADDPGLCLGYRGRPEIWSQTQKDGWYYTKDLAIATRTDTCGMRPVRTI